MALDARVHTADPEPSDFSYQRTIDIRFRSGYIAYALFFDVENHASETFDGGWNDLTETYLEVYGTLPDQLYEIDRVVLYTGPSFARRVAVGLKKSERTVRLAQSGAPMPGLAYSHRITRAEFKGRVLRK